MFSAPSLFVSLFHHSCFDHRCEALAPGWAGGFRECQALSLPSGDHSFQTCLRYQQAWCFDSRLQCLCFASCCRKCTVEHINLSLSRFII